MVNVQMFGEGAEHSTRGARGTQQFAICAARFATD